jgi:hypothetical protein
MAFLIVTRISKNSLSFLKKYNLSDAVLTVKVTRTTGGGKRWTVIERNEPGACVYRLSLAVYRLSASQARKTEN